MNKLPFEEFYGIISSEDLNVSEEIEVVKVINKYLQHRANLPPSEDEPVDLSHLTEEEKKNREEQKAKKDEEQKAKKAEEEKKKEEEFAKLDEPKKIQHKIDE